jgi:hypothetical protein
LDNGPIALERDPELANKSAMLDEQTRQTVIKQNKPGFFAGVMAEIAQRSYSKNTLPVVQDELKTQLDVAGIDANDPNAKVNKRDFLKKVIAFNNEIKASQAEPVAFSKKMAEFRNFLQTELSSGDEYRTKGSVVDPRKKRLQELDKIEASLRNQLLMLHAKNGNDIFGGMETIVNKQSPTGNTLTTTVRRPLSIYRDSATGQLVKTDESGNIIQ